MVTQSISKALSKNGSKSKVHLTPYLERVEKALSKALLKMEPYDEDAHIVQKINTNTSCEEKRTTLLPFRPYVELGTAPIESEHIEDLQKIRPFGVNLNKNMALVDTAVVVASENKTSASGKQVVRGKNDGSTVRKRESCLIESTSNSIRISFLFKAQANSKAKTDPLEASIVFQWMRFLMVQEQHPLLRKKPIKGYSVTFLVTSKHLSIHGAKTVEDSILGFCAKIDKECSDIKLQVNAQARYVTTEFLKAFNNQTESEEKCNY